MIWSSVGAIQTSIYLDETERRELAESGYDEPRRQFRGKGEVVITPTNISAYIRIQPISQSSFKPAAESAHQRVRRLMYDDHGADDDVREGLH